MPGDLEGPEDVRVVWQGPKGAVALGRKARKERSKLDQRAAAQLDRYFKHFCEHGFSTLPPEHFKAEGRFPVGDGTELLVHAFKPWQWRLYGTIKTVGGRPMFIGVCVDNSKKRNKADQDLLRRTARTLRSYL
jgi:hypothetical protein